MFKTLLLCGALCAAGAAQAQETTLTFEPSKTQVHWTLDAMLHTVHGTFKLRSGTVRFNRSTGAAGGELIVDALSGESGSGARDKKMHTSILESAKFADVVFRPDHVEGAVPTQGDGTIQVHGQFVLHGQSHEMTLPVQLHVAGGVMTAKSHFTVPYLQWGLKNPSTLMLRVDDKVEITIHTIARTM